MNDVVVDTVLWDISCKILHDLRTNKEGTLDSHILAVLEESGLKEAIVALEFYADPDSRMKVKGTSLFDIERGKRAIQVLARLKKRANRGVPPQPIDSLDRDEEVNALMSWLGKLSEEFDCRTPSGRTRAVKMAKKAIERIEELEHNG